MTALCSLLNYILLLIAVPAFAGTEADTQQNHTDIIKAVTTFINAQTQTLPGQVSIKVDGIDQRVVRPHCPTLEIFLPSGSHLLGNSMVGVRCPDKNGWILFVPVHVTVSAEVLITSRALPQGHVLLAEDISTQRGELAQLDILTDPALAVGKIVKNGVGAGQILKQDMLRTPYVITQGQTVKLQASGTGFNIRSEGQALGNAADGQTVQVKSASGQVVSGTARPDGVVEIRP